MPSFLSRHGSNRLKKPRKIGGEEANGGTGTETGGGGGGGGGGRGGTGPAAAAGKDPKSSLISFTTVSNKSSTNSSTSVNKLQRSESSKRRFGLNNILTRGKNRTDTGQGTVSSKIGDMRHRAAGSGEPEVGSKDGTLPATSQQQPSAHALQLVRTPPEKSSNPPNTITNTNNSPTRVIAPLLSLPPTVSPVISAPAEFSSQQLDGPIAATATMTSTMQQSNRPSLPLTLSVNFPPYHAPQAHPSFPSNIPQISKLNSSLLPSSSSSSFPDNEKSTSMLNTIDTYSPLLSSPVVANATAVSFSRPVLVDGRPQVGHPNSLNDTIGTPLGYYITPSQTPTLLDRPDTHFVPRAVPTVLRPGPSTPPLTESSVSVSMAVAKIPAPETQLQLAGNSNVPGDRLFNNGPPTPTSSNSSQKERDQTRHVNFLEENRTPTSSIRSIRSNVGNIYPNPPPPLPPLPQQQQNRFNNYRPPPGRPPPGRPPPGRPRGNPSRTNQSPLRGHPRRIPIRGPPQPPSPIYMPPPDMKNHEWIPLKPSQLECSMGHSLVPFRNKQHSIPCTVCRSTEFEGRGEPVKRSYYCSWCAVRMCGGCKEELGVCQGKLAELWDKTEEKRSENMAMIKDGSRREIIKRATPEVQNLKNESPGPTPMNPENERGRGKTSQKMPGIDAGGSPFPRQRTPPRGQPQQQLAILQPQQSMTQQPQQSKTPQTQQLRTPQTPSYGGRVPQQSRQSSRGPPPPSNSGGYFPPASDLSRPRFPAQLPQPVPQLTPAETERYRIVSVPTEQKPPQSSTVVLVGEKPKESGTLAASLKGSVTKKRNWFRSFGKKKEA